MGAPLEKTEVNSTSSQTSWPDSKGDAHAPIRAGPFEVQGQAGVSGEGPYIILYFQGNDEIVEKAWFETHGCISSIRCGDWLCKWAIGRTLSSLSIINAQDLQLVVGGLPLGKEFCAEMAIEALMNSLSA